MADEGVGLEGAVGAVFEVAVGGDEDLVGERAAVVDEAGCACLAIAEVGVCKGLGFLVEQDLERGRYVLTVVVYDCGIERWSDTTEVSCF